MVLIDSSAWIEYLRHTGSDTNLRVRELLAADDPVATTDVVVSEVLAGARNDAHWEQLQRLVYSARPLAVRPLFDYEEAALIYLACRRGGATPRRLTDCLIAAVAIRESMPLLH
ncbi:MAG: type II toxin-antitoxin system VapC family toxin, partial [Acidimicrobiia bacterium]